MFVAARRICRYPLDFYRTPEGRSPMKVWACVSLAVLCVTSLVAAEIPLRIGYQGRVTDNLGNPVADGTYTMRFRVYDQLVGGTLLWDSSNLSVQLSGGVFNVSLGGAGQPSLDLAFDQDYWLQVTFDGETQTPRRVLASVGYAYMASGLVPGTEVIGSVTSSPYAAVKGTNTATQYVTYGLYGESASTSGRGVSGLATAPTGYTHGVTGGSASTDGHGVYGIADATDGFTYGVHGVVLSTGGVGAYGQALAGTGPTRGVLGISSSTSGKGVHGVADATAGDTYGVYGSSSSSSGVGVYGIDIATTGTTYGVYGESASMVGRGVHGEATRTTGSNYGVFGSSASSYGTGVYGRATATTGTTYGVYGTADSPSGYAGFFVGDARVTGDLTVDGSLTGPGIGDITAVYAGTGLDGGGTSGSVTLDVEVPLELAGAQGDAVIRGTNTYTTGSSGVWGEATATTGAAWGVYATSASSGGRGVNALATATSGTTYGVHAESESSAGRGVFGHASSGAGDTYGVVGRSDSPSGVGVRGYAAQTWGTNYGVQGETASSTGFGVYGFAPSTTGDTWGVYGESASNAGRGVQGLATSTADTTFGVYGESHSSAGRGVYGVATHWAGPASGVVGECYSSSVYAYGVAGYNNNPNAGTWASGVYGESEATEGIGVKGFVTHTTGANYGVWGHTGSWYGCGVYGKAMNGVGTWSYGGYFENFGSGGTGAYGLARDIGNPNYGVYGETWSSVGYGVYYDGGFGGTGKMTSIVLTSKGPTGLGVHTTAGDWVEDFGEGMLINGRGHVELDPMFLETVTISEDHPAKVFVQSQDPTCNGVAAIPGSTGFDVVELLEGRSNGAFAYRVIATRKGFEDNRLELVEAARNSSYLYPELREQRMREAEEKERARARLKE
jgi:hypothetical protein